MTPNDIQNRQFGRGMNGYRPDEVNQFKNEVAEVVRGLIRERDELMEKLGVLAEKVEEYRADEESLRAALIGAQKLGDSVVRDAKSKAQALLEEAARQSESMVEKATREARTLVGNVKRDIDIETYALEKKRHEAAHFKTQLLNMYKKHIDMINALPHNEEQLDPMPENPFAGQQAAAPVQETEEPETEEEIVDSAEEVEEIRLEYEETDDKDAIPFPARKSRYGKLRFGEDYSLERKD